MTSQLAINVVQYLRDKGYELPDERELGWSVNAALDELLALPREERLNRVRARDISGLCQWHHTLSDEARASMMEYIIWCIDF